MTHTSLHRRRRTHDLMDTRRQNLGRVRSMLKGAGADERAPQTEPHEDVSALIQLDHPGH